MRQDRCLPKPAADWECFVVLTSMETSGNLHRLRRARSHPGPRIHLCCKLLHEQSGGPGSSPRNPTPRPSDAAGAPGAPPRWTGRRGDVSPRAKACSLVWGATPSRGTPGPLLPAAVFQVALTRRLLAHCVARARCSRTGRTPDPSGRQTRLAAASRAASSTRTSWRSTCSWTGGGWRPSAPA